MTGTGSDMPLEFNRRVFLARAAAAGMAGAALGTRELAESGESSRLVRSSLEYGLDFTNTQESLVGDLLHGQRGDPQRQSEVPFHEWYAAWVRHRYGAWGPPVRSYAALEDLEARPLQWKRERVIATAARFIGYEYQHHHVPDWNPPANWPWKSCCAGHNGRGFDCSNFTSFVYNQGFGIRMSSAVGHQGEARTARFEALHVPVHRVELPAPYVARREALRTGDLLFIRGREGGHVTHVVLWVGSIGRTPNHEPLVLDSHGSGVVGEDGRPIPCGVHLRPFREDSWYNRCASHAHRIFH